MPDKNIQLPDGRVVAFPDSMSDDAISTVLQKQFPAKTSGSDFAKWMGSGSAVQANSEQIPNDPAHPFMSAMAQEAMGDVNEAMAKKEFMTQHPWINGIGDFLSTAPFSMGGLVQKILPNSARALENLGTVAKAVGEINTRPPDEVSKALYDVLTQVEKSDTGAPPIVKKFEAWMTDPSKGVSWQDLRDFQSQLGKRVILDENKNVIKDPKVLRSMGNLFGQVKEWALDIADEHGALDPFEQGLKEYGKAQGIKETVRTVAKTAGPWALRGAAGGVGGGAAYDASKAAYNTVKAMLGN